MVANAENTITVIELKDLSLSSFDDGMFGLAYDYLITIARAQKSRRDVIAVLRNLRLNYILHLHSPNLAVYESIDFYNLIRFLKSVVLRKTQYLPPRSPFSTDFGHPLERLGQSNHCAASKFTVPDFLQAELNGDNTKFRIDTGTGQTRIILRQHPKNKSLAPAAMAVKRGLKVPGDHGSLKSAGASVQC